MRWAARIDANKAEIVSYLRKAGCTVYDLKQPVDLLVGIGGQTVLVELKDGNKRPSEQKYTPAQLAFLTTWKGGPVATIRDLQGAETMLASLRRKALDEVREIDERLSDLHIR